jgi:hypothetical protein
MADARPWRVTTASRNYVKISRTELRSNWSINMKMTDRNSFTFLLQCECHSTTAFTFLLQCDCHSTHNIYVPTAVWLPQHHNIYVPTAVWLPQHQHFQYLSQEISWHCDRRCSPYCWVSRHVDGRTDAASPQVCFFHFVKDLINLS